MGDEWRVEVELGEEGHGLSIGERLRTLDLDDEARERLGDRVVVTRDGSKMFLYTRSESEARAAEGVVRRLVDEEGITAETAVTRWDEEADAWAPDGGGARAAEPEPSAGAEWEARVALPSARKALEVARELRDEGLEVRRRWRYVFAHATTEEHANQLADRLRTELPEAEWVDVERAREGVTHPAFIVIGAAEPGIARDLGL